MRADSNNTQSTPQQLRSLTRWREIFEDRHGDGAYERLYALLERPCVPFSRIAHRFGVTRECVRQWHRMLMPDAPRGHARQRLCVQLKWRQRVLADPLFRTFFVQVRRVGRGYLVEMLPGSTGYRTRLARINGRLVSIQQAKPLDGNGDPGTRSFALNAYTGPAEYLFVRLNDEEYLFVPSTALAVRTVFVENGYSPLLQFKNTLDAVSAGERGETLAS